MKIEEKSIRQKIKDLFSDLFLNKVSNGISEQPEKIHNCLKISLPIVLLALIYTKRIGQYEDILKDYKNQHDYIKVKVSPSSVNPSLNLEFIKYNTETHTVFNELFNQRLHSLIDYMGAYFGIKSFSVQLILNSLFPNAIDIFESLNRQAQKSIWRSKKLKREEKLLIKAIPESFNLQYIFGSKIRN